MRKAIKHMSSKTISSRAAQILISRLGARLGLGWISLGFLLTGVVPTTLFSQSTYVGGDIIEDFTLVNRTTGEPLRLSEFEGKIIFLEWFAWW